MKLPLAQKRYAIGAAALCAALGVRAQGTELTPRTVEAFQHYVVATEARMQKEVANPATFLYFDSLPEKQKRVMLARLRSGRVIIEPMHTRENGREIEIPDGLVHDWLAIGFIPGATRDQALSLAEDYARQPAIFSPDVQRTQVLSHEGQHYRVYFRLCKQAIVTVTYDTEFSVDYFLPDPTRAYSVTRAVRIAEVQNPGKSNEQELPPGQDHGYMWRFNLYTRYLERNNGVYLQIEFLALSRMVPTFFAWLVNPYIRSIPREYLTHFVLVTRRELTPATGGTRATTD